MTQPSALTELQRQIELSLAMHQPVWSFPTWSFRSIEEGLGTIVDLISNERYNWWLTADACAALLELGKDEMAKGEIKGQIAAALGCSIRTVEIRVKAARKFPPHTRLPDVPIQLYKEALECGEKPLEVLRDALAEGITAAELERRRLGLSGRPLFRRCHAILHLSQQGGFTYYQAEWQEIGSPRTSRLTTRLPALVSVWELSQAAEESQENRKRTAKEEDTAKEVEGAWEASLELPALVRQ
mgnify:CR=1 FL=1